jgi:glycosyltransferase involved in cell wall biosynthesis
MKILISGEYFPKVGGVARYVETIERELVRDNCDFAVLTRNDIRIDDRPVYPLLPVSWKRLAVFYWLIRVRNFLVSRPLGTEFYFLDFAGLLVYLVCSNSEVRRRSKIVFHGTEILRLRELLKFRILQQAVFSRILQARKLVAISSVIRSILTETLHTQDIQVIYNSHPFSGKFVIPDNYNEDLTISVVGRLDYRKRIDLLLKSIPLIKHKSTIKIVGSGPTEDVILSIISKYRNPIVDVQLLKDIDDRQLKEIYSKSHYVFVPAGRLKNSIEGFGLTILEALDCNSIPVCLDLDGPGEIAQILGTPRLAPNVKDIAAFFNNWTNYFDLIDQEHVNSQMSLFTPERQARDLFET